jgi:hypothetical protein
MYRSNRGETSTPETRQTRACVFLIPISVLSCNVLRQSEGQNARADIGDDINHLPPNFTPIANRILAGR